MSLLWIPALVVMGTVVVLVIDDKHRHGREWTTVFYRAPLSWREYLKEKKNFITARLGKKTKNDKRRKSYG